MRRSHVAVFIHHVWATWDRWPFLTDDVRPVIYRAIGATCAEVDAEVVAIGGVDDHVHLLVRQPATLSIAEVMKRAKGSPAHLMTHQLAPRLSFKWQGGYGAVSVSPGGVDAVREYITRQAEHHRDGTLRPEWEPTGMPSGIGEASRAGAGG